MTSPPHSSDLLTTATVLFKERQCHVGGFLKKSLRPQLQRGRPLIKYHKAETRKCLKTCGPTQGGIGSPACGLGEHTTDQQPRTSAKSLRVTVCTKLGANTYALTTEGQVLESLRAGLIPFLFLEDSLASNTITQ